MPRGTPHTDLSPELLEHMKAIKAKAIEYGLDFFEVVFEVLDFETMNQIAAYGGFPVRYPHWRWGMEYDRLSKRDAYGMGRIYEMVINNDPCYAYLQESNSVTDQKLVMAHVYGHADFFKHNLWFGKTNRKMMDEMANHATRVRRHIERQGQETVERFLDACLSIEHLIDPHSVFMGKRGGQGSESRGAEEGGQDHGSEGRATGDRALGGRATFSPDKLPAKDYMDPFINPAKEMTRQREAWETEQREARRRFPAEPARDVLAFLLAHAPLEDWQADILGIVRDEAYYFAPQGMTKVMNEGWATYWHSKLMTQHFLEAKEIIDYAEQHSGVVHMPPGGFNPYKIGVEMFKDIERRWDRGQHGPAWDRLGDIGAKEAFNDKSMKGREKIFEVRKIYNDVNFIDEFLTPEFVERHQMYQFRRDPQTGEVRVVTRDFQRVKQTLLFRLTNMGQPFIYVADANYANRGELYLAHKYMGLEVDASKGVEALRAIASIWGRPVHLQGRVNEELVLISLAGPEAEPERRVIGEGLSPPAHAIE
jgi:stage V sporulation protein R